MNLTITPLLFKNRYSVSQNNTSSEAAKNTQNKYMSGIDSRVDSFISFKANELPSDKSVNAVTLGLEAKNLYQQIETVFETKEENYKKSLTASLKKISDDDSLFFSEDVLKKIPVSVKLQAKDNNKEYTLVKEFTDNKYRYSLNIKDEKNLNLTFNIEKNKFVPVSDISDSIDINKTAVEAFDSIIWKYVAKESKIKEYKELFNSIPNNIQRNKPIMRKTINSGIMPEFKEPRQYDIKTRHGKYEFLQDNLDILFNKCTDIKSNPPYYTHSELTKQFICNASLIDDVIGTQKDKNGNTILEMHFDKQNGIKKVINYENGKPKQAYKLRLLENGRQSVYDFEQFVEPKFKATRDLGYIDYFYDKDTIYGTCSADIKDYGKVYVFNDSNSLHIEKHKNDFGEKNTNYALIEHIKVKFTDDMKNIKEYVVDNYKKRYDSQDKLESGNGTFLSRTVYNPENLKTPISVTTDSVYYPASIQLFREDGTLKSCEKTDCKLLGTKRVRYREIYAPDGKTIEQYEILDNCKTVTQRLTPQKAEILKKNNLEQERLEEEAKAQAKAEEEARIKAEEKARAKAKKKTRSSKAPKK